MIYQSIKLLYMHLQNMIVMGELVHSCANDLPNFARPTSLNVECIHCIIFIWTWLRDRHIHNLQTEAPIQKTNGILFI